MFSASQLIDFPYGDGIDLALGGGRKNFLRTTDVDDNNNKLYGLRQDGRNLKSEWISKSKDHIYVHNRNGFKQLKPNLKKKVLGRCIMHHHLFLYLKGRNFPGRKFRNLEIKTQRK